MKQETPTIGQTTVGSTTAIEEKKKETRIPRTETLAFDSEAGFNLIQRQAALYADSDLVPELYRKNIPNCVVALNMAKRLGADVLMVMQNLYTVYGRPAWFAKFLIATWNESGRGTAIRYRFQGKEGTDTWGCRAWSVEKETGQELVGALVTVELAKKEGWYDRKSKDGKPASKWPTLTELMLMWRAGAWFVNFYAPELSMGIKSIEEEIDVGPELLEKVIAKTEKKLAIEDLKPKKAEVEVEGAKPEPVAQVATPEHKDKAEAVVEEKETKPAKEAQDTKTKKADVKPSAKRIGLKEISSIYALIHELKLADKEVINVLGVHGFEQVHEISVNALENVIQDLKDCAKFGGAE